MFAGLLGDSTASGVPGQQDWWQDRNLEFDTSKSRLELTRGEQIQHSFENSVDCKGNVGCSGTISITNLRILWVCDKQPSLNLSIGLNIVFTIFFGAQLNNDVAAAADDQYLNITAKTKDSTYQFLFKADDNSRIEQLRATANQFNVLLSQYNQSKIYRDVFLKKRCVVKDAAARLLLHESLHEKLDGVSNVASDQGNLGVFYITNFRVIWHSILNERFSISLPYLQIDGVSLTKSKYGLALAIRTTQYAESMKIGFRIDSEERTKAVAKTIKMLWKVYLESPVYGVGFITDNSFDAAIDDKSSSSKKSRQNKAEGTITLTETSTANDYTSATSPTTTTDSPFLYSSTESPDMMVNGTIPQLDPAIKTGTIHRPNNFTTATVGEISQFDVMSGGGGSDHLNDTEVAFQFDEFLGLAAEIHPDKKTTKEIWSWA